MSRIRLILYGATGSVGSAVLRVMDSFPDRFELAGFSYHGNHERAAEIVRKFNVSKVICTGSGDALPSFVTGNSPESLLDQEADKVIIAIVGAAGIRLTLESIRRGFTVASANKESLVAAGDLVMPLVRPGKLIPVDSEHSSVFRLLNGADASVSRIILTASGGPLREFSIDKIRALTRAQVMAHPTWSMGPKITVDSAGLVNKALEIIEAHHLFSRPYDELEAVVHPQSWVHAITRLTDGTFQFHVSRPDMVYPVAYAMFYPEESPFISSSYTADIPDLSFEPIDTIRFPGYALGLECGRAGGYYPALFNAANEQAVSLFLDDQIPFYRINELTAESLQNHPFVDAVMELDAILEADAWARRRVLELHK